MATSIRQFNVDLYREHLEEGSFLYDQRLAYLHDPEINWPDLRDWEDRFEAHLDALAVGGELALEVCREQAAGSDPGQLHTALRVLCRQNQKDVVLAILAAIDPANEGAARAAAQAICRDAPTGWRNDLLGAFQGDQQIVTCVLARVIGYRRFQSEDILRSKLAQQPLIGRAELAWALGRVGTAASVPLLLAQLEGAEPGVSQTAAIASMRLGDDRPLKLAMQAAPAQAWAWQVLAVGGTSRAVDVLLDAVAGEAAGADAVIALGLLGDLSAVAPLVDLLDHEELAEPAAVALNTITGAQLLARIFVPEEVDMDELSAEEREAFDRDGTLPTRNGKPYGNWERRPVRDKTVWLAWLGDNKHRFNRQQRWRMGKPHGPAALLECLRSETTPYRVRALTYDELVVRFGLDVPFEVDLPVSQQMRFLGKIEDWVAQQSGHFDEGRWDFAGQLQG